MVEGRAGQSEGRGFGACDSSRGGDFFWCWLGLNRSLDGKPWSARQGTVRNQWSHQWEQSKVWRGADGRQQQHVNEVSSGEAKQGGQPRRHNRDGASSRRRKGCARLGSSRRAGWHRTAAQCITVERRVREPAGSEDGGRAIIGRRHALHQYNMRGRRLGIGWRRRKIALGVDSGWPVV